MTGEAQGRARRDRPIPAAPPDAVPLAAGRSEHDKHTEPILEQPVDGDSLYQLRAAVAAHALQAGLPPRRADDLVIAAHELAANVVVHGSGHGRLRIWRHDRTLQCQITDDAGAGSADPSSWRIEPGHGLWLIHQLADDLSLCRGEGGGSAVTVSFIVTPPDGEDTTSG